MAAYAPPLVPTRFTFPQSRRRHSSAAWRPWSIHSSSGKASTRWDFPFPRKSSKITRKCWVYRGRRKVNIREEAVFPWRNRQGSPWPASW